jgi:hypothetical protein
MFHPGDDHRFAHSAGSCLAGHGNLPSRPRAIEHDGVVIGLGFAATALALVIVTAVSAGIVGAVRHWFTG